MLRKIVLISVISLICSNLVGCELVHPQLRSDTDCTRLKRQALYNNTNPNYEAAWTTSAQHDNLKQQLVRNNCAS